MPERCDHELAAALASRALHHRQPAGVRDQCRQVGPFHAVTVPSRRSSTLVATNSSPSHQTHVHGVVGNGRGAVDQQVRRRPEAQRHVSRSSIARAESRGAMATRRTSASEKNCRSGSSSVVLLASAGTTAVGPFSMSSRMMASAYAVSSFSRPRYVPPRFAQHLRRGRCGRAHEQRDGSEQPAHHAQSTRTNAESITVGAGSTRSLGRSGAHGAQAKRTL